MMKKIQILLLGAMLGLTACNDWLDVNPKTSILQINSLVLNRDLKTH